ncbi:hypothetical protein DIPPA_20535 [Diplonema papillatum]|nr:hypothetical protein DIPPA_20535 [Diplonema papillatum]
MKGTKRCNEALRRYYDQAQNLLAKQHDRRTTIEPVHIPRELSKDADELSNRAMDTASDRRHRPTVTGGTGLQRLGDRERVGDEDRAEQVGQGCARESRPPGPRDARQPPRR